MKFYIVDAFTDKVFGGNPAGVVLVSGSEFPSEETMINTAAELRYSETVFAKNLGGGSWQLRYFTPTDEVDLCGHATIAAFSVIDKRQGGDGAYLAVTGAGEINIDVSSNLVMMDMATPHIMREINSEEEWVAIRKILNLAPENLLRTGAFRGIGPAVVSTGLPDLIFPVDSVEELNAIEPNFEFMSKMSEMLEVVGVHAYALTHEGANLRIDCRNFAPLYGIPEESATGTANGALTYYLLEKGIVGEGQLNTITQGTSMGRPSQIVTLALTDGVGNTVIRVGGSAAILAEGHIEI